MSPPDVHLHSPTLSSSSSVSPIEGSLSALDNINDNRPTERRIPDNYITVIVKQPLHVFLKTWDELQRLLSTLRENNREKPCQIGSFLQFLL